MRLHKSNTVHHRSHHQGYRLGFRLTDDSVGHSFPAPSSLHNFPQSAVRVQDRTVLLNSRLGSRCTSRLFYHQISRILGEFKEVGVVLLQPNPLRFALIETEVASGARSPFIILWQAETALLQNSVDIPFGDAVLFEGVFGFNISCVNVLQGFITNAVLVGTDSDVVVSLIFADKFLEGFDFQ